MTDGETAGAGPAGTRPGRPRSRAVDEAVVRAVFELFAEVGYADMTMGKVAARAGVARATLYRRWETKEQMVTEALSQLTTDFVVHRTGDVEEDFLELARELLRRGFESPAGQMLPRVLNQVITNPEFLTIYLEKVFQPRSEVMAALVRTGQERHEVRDDVAPELLIDLVGGFILYRLFLRPDAEFDHEVLRQAVSVIFKGAHPR